MSNAWLEPIGGSDNMTHNMAYTYMNDWPEKLGIWANWKITHGPDAHLD